MSAAGMRSVKALDKNVVYDPDMPMGVIKNLTKAGQESDIGSMMEGLRQLVNEWDFDGDPKDMASWDALRRSEFLAITSAVMEDMGKLGEA